MYCVCLTILVVSLVVYVRAVENACTCERGSLSSTVTCTIFGQNDVFTIAANYCNNRISVVELHLLRHTYLSSTIVPDINMFRLQITGEYLKHLSEDAFSGHEASLKSVEIKDGALSEVPIAALNRLRHLESLNLAENSIRSINCSLNDINLKHLILLDNQISTVYSCAFPSGLYSLTLRNNRLETLNGSLKHHSSLKLLFIARNKLTSLEGELEGVDSLSLFDASWNKIGTIGMNPIRLPALNYLNISHNRISDLGSSLNGFINLYTLDLSYNELENLNAQLFVNLTNLGFLSLSANNIRTLDDNVFAHLWALKTLIISQNVVTSLDDKLNGLISLEKLDASWNNIKIIGNAFVDRTSLVELDLSNNRIADVGDSFTGLYKLERLVLSDNDIKQLKEGVFSQLSSLQVLILSNNMIGSLSGSSFAHLTKLQTLDLSFNILLQSVDTLIISGFMDIDLESSAESIQSSCGCKSRSLTKHLIIEGNFMVCYSDNITSTVTRLKEHNVELVGC